VLTGGAGGGAEGNACSPVGRRDGLHLRWRAARSISPVAGRGGP